MNQNSITINDDLDDGEWHMSARVNEPEFGTAHMSPTETYTISIDTVGPTTDADQPHRRNWSDADIRLDIDLETTDPIENGERSGLSQSRYFVTQD